MASWIIVSSRWVAGLSTGIRPVSAMRTRKRAAKASIWAGARKCQVVEVATLAISERLVELAPMATVKTATIMGGLGGGALGTFREGVGDLARRAKKRATTIVGGGGRAFLNVPAPPEIPPKAEPVSNPA